MASEDFIELGSDAGSEASEMVTDNQALEPIEACPDEDSPDSDNLEKVEPHGRESDQQLPQSVVHDEDLIHQSSVLQEGVELTESVTVVDSVDIVEPGHMENGCTDFSSVSKHMLEQSSMTGVKRSRVTSDERPSVYVVYKSLTRASRKKLEELLQQWSEWHAQNEASSDASLKEALEHGEETYFPALYVGSEKSAMVSFRVDKRARKGESDYVDSDLVPLYDRGYALGSTSAVGSADSERVEPLEASRCFNCGSYSHSLKDCPKPRDNVAISLARKQHGSKRNSVSGSRNSTRYYQSSSGGKYDDLKAGVLGPELRNCLGIGELDPPPWLYRMRELGYPPGYLDAEEDEDQPSGITIYADEETKTEYEEGELPEKGEPESPEKKMTVDFPGVNAPIPENADRRRWAASPGLYSSSDSFKSRSQHRSMHSETHRGSLPDQKRSWDYRENGPPSADYGLSSSALCHSPGYSPYDHNRSVPRSPDLRRSLSDRGRGPSSQEGSPGHILQSTSPYSSGHPQSAERYSRTVTIDHRAFESQYNDDSLRRDRSNHRHHQRR